MAGPLAVGQQILYERTVARAGRKLGSRHLDGDGAACAGGCAGAVSAGAVGLVGSIGTGVGDIAIAGIVAGNILIIILFSPLLQ